jgi:hypothetical protein
MYCNAEHQAALEALAGMSVEEQLAALGATDAATDLSAPDSASHQLGFDDRSCSADPGLDSSAEDTNICGGAAAASAQAGLGDQAGEADAIADAPSAAAEEVSHREVVGDGSGSGYMPHYRERFFTADGSSCAAGSGMLVSMARATVSAV